MESVNALGQKIVQELKSDQKEVYGCVARDYGCEIAGTQAVVRLLITILPQNAKLLEPDLHLSEKVFFEFLICFIIKDFTIEYGLNSTFSLV